MKTREEQNAYALAWYHKNKARLRDKFKVKYRSNHQFYRDQMDAARVRRLYGISLSEWKQLIDGSRTCPICHKRPAVVLDHCHRSGKTRDALCSKCNWGLGSFDDDMNSLISAIEYLANHQPVIV